MKPAGSSTPPPTVLLLLLLSAALMVLGIGGPLLLRLYFLHGGSRLWLSSFLQFAACPLLLIPILLFSSFAGRRPFHLPPSALAAFAAFGLFFGVNGYLFGNSSSNLPLSTSSILNASQLSFTAFFSYFINRQRFTPYSINAVFLLTIGPIVLGLSSSSDRPAGETNAKYYLGFTMALLGALLLGVLLPTIEKTYRRLKEGLDFGVMLETQMVLSVFASGFCLVGMAASKDFQAIGREAREFGLGEMKYYVVLVCSAVLFQFSNVGLVGVIFCSSSLFGGILNAVLLPMSEVLAVIFFREKFTGSKGIALVLYLWGFTSYLYGERRQSKKVKKLEVDLPSATQAV